MILALRTDSNISEYYLLDTDGRVKRELKWESGRELADGIHQKIGELLGNSKLDHLIGLIVFSGPGSFTGLRIGVTVANALAYAHSLPIVGSNGDEWLRQGRDKLTSGGNEYQVLPHYGAEPKITKPGKSA